MRGFLGISQNLERVRSPAPGPRRAVPQLARRYTARAVAPNTLRPRPAGTGIGLWLADGMVHEADDRAELYLAGGARMLFPAPPPSHPNAFNVSTQVYARPGRTLYPTAVSAAAVNGLARSASAKDLDPPADARGRFPQPRWRPARRSEPLTASLLLDSPKVSAPMPAGGAVAAGLRDPDVGDAAPGRRGELAKLASVGPPSPRIHRWRPRPRRVFRGANSRRSAVLEVPGRAFLVPLATRSDRVPLRECAARRRPAMACGRRLRRSRPVHAAATATLVSTPHPNRERAGALTRGSRTVVRLRLTHWLACSQRRWSACSRTTPVSTNRRRSSSRPTAWARLTASPFVGEEFEAAGEYGPRGDDDLRPAAVAEA